MMTPLFPRRPMAALWLLPLVALSGPALAEDAFWLMRVPSGALATTAGARPFPAADQAVLQDIYARLPDAAGGPPQCLALSSAMIEQAELSPPTAVLAGLSEVGLVFNAPKPPPGFDAGFAETVSARLVDLFTKQGLRVSSADEASRLPGQPRLTLGLTFTDPDGTCAYSYAVSASLTQTAVLTRNPAAKFNATTWSVFARSGPDFGPGQEADLPLDVAGRFLEAWAQANGLAPATVAGP